MRDEEDMNSQMNKMGRKLQELSDVEKRNNEYENKVVLATQEIERLNKVLRERNNELNNFNHQIKEYEMRFPKMED